MSYKFKNPEEILIIWSGYKPLMARQSFYYKSLSEQFEDEIKDSLLEFAKGASVDTDNPFYEQISLMFRFFEWDNVNLTYSFEFDGFKFSGDIEGLK